MTTRIHPTAIVASDARLGEDIDIGPWAVVGEDCTIGDGCAIAARATRERHGRLASNVRIGIQSIIGGEPQDLKCRGELTTVQIGQNSVVRE